MTGMILDGVLMLLLVAALGYGIRLEKKLAALRAGQLAFASAVTELNTAAGRAEQALATLRASGHETDLLHDRVVKARELKVQLETLIARGGDIVPSRATAIQAEAKSQPALVATPASDADDGRAERMAALADRIRGLNTAAQPAPGRGDVAAIVGALRAGGVANHAAKQRLTPTRRTLDEDLFAA